MLEIGSVLCGAAQSSNMLIIGRAVAGLGGSGLSNGALTIIGAAAPMHKRPGRFFHYWYLPGTNSNYSNNGDDDV